MELFVEKGSLTADFSRWSRSEAPHENKKARFVFSRPGSVRICIWREADKETERYIEREGERTCLVHHSNAVS
jgi:hypothetical protein